MQVMFPNKALCALRPLIGADKGVPKHTVSQCISVTAISEWCACSVLQLTRVVCSSCGCTPGELFSRTGVFKMTTI